MTLQAPNPEKGIALMRIKPRNNCKISNILKEVNTSIFVWHKTRVFIESMKQFFKPKLYAYKMRLFYNIYS